MTKKSTKTTKSSKKTTAATGKTAKRAKPANDRILEKFSKTGKPAVEKNERRGLLPHEQVANAGTKSEAADPVADAMPTEPAIEPTTQPEAKSTPQAESTPDAAPVAPGGDLTPAAASNTTEPSGGDTGEPGATGGNPPSLATSSGGQRRLGILSAAAKVLEEHDGQEPLNCQQMLEQITAKGYWAPKRGGKTPSATLYAAILMEIRNKGEASRFEKVARGRFILKNHS